MGRTAAGTGRRSSAWPSSSIPTNANSLNNLAWLLASVPDVPPQDPSQALEAARKAVSLEPENWMFWNTLGVAAYRAGDWKAAEEALEKSMGLNKGGEAADWFFLAMTRQRQGRPDEARQVVRPGRGLDQREPAEGPRAPPLPGRGRGAPGHRQGAPGLEAGRQGVTASDDRAVLGRGAGRRG